MEFHGIPWNFGGANFRWHEQFHGIPWNLKCANFADMRSSMEFHGIPWNFGCANFADTSSSMEFHGTLGAPISLTRAVPWNSMELEVRQFQWHEKFHGIPWNFGCANFADTSSSMEFHLSFLISTVVSDVIMAHWSRASHNLYPGCWLNSPGIFCFKHHNNLSLVQLHTFSVFKPIEMMYSSDCRKQSHNSWNKKSYYTAFL